MRSYCILCSSRTTRWYQILDVANVRQADLTACLSKSIYIKQLLGSSTHFTSRTTVYLNTPQDQVRDTRKHNGQFEAYIHTIRLINQATYRSSDWCRVPVYCEYLSKSKGGAYQTKHHRHYRSPANWESTGRIPIIDIVPPMTEHKVFDDENDCIGTQPVCNEKHETLQSLIKVTTNSNQSNRNCDIDNCPYERPHISRDTHKPLPENLHRETKAIIIRNIVKTVLRASKATRNVP